MNIRASRFRASVDIEYEYVCNGSCTSNGISPCDALSSGGCPTGECYITNIEAHYTFCGGFQQETNPAGDTSDNYLYLSAGPSISGGGGGASSFIINPANQCNGSIICSALHQYLTFKLTLPFAQQQYLNANSEIDSAFREYFRINGYLPNYVSFFHSFISYIILHPELPIVKIRNYLSTNVEGSDGIYDEEFWENTNINLPQQSLPTLLDYYNAFPKNEVNGYILNMSATDVYQLVGGTILTNHLSGNPNYQNGCSLRGSRGLNYSGNEIPVVFYEGNQKTEKGSDNKNYILSASAFNAYMNKTFGTPTYSLTYDQIAGDVSTVINFLQGKTGIYTIINQSPGDAGYTGHVDLIINGTCVGGPNISPKGGIKKIEIWELNN